MKTIETLPWAKGPEGGEIHLYKMTNAVGASVVLSEIGAGIVEIIFQRRPVHGQDSRKICQQDSRREIHT